jgi:hypothetical protein
MAHELRVMLEIGPKGKKVVAVAPDWPGLERGAKTGEAAVERLQSYLPRYAHVVKLAGEAVRPYGNGLERGMTRRESGGTTSQKSQMLLLPRLHSRPLHGDSGRQT